MALSHVYQVTSHNGYAMVMAPQTLSMYYYHSYYQPQTTCLHPILCCYFVFLQLHLKPAVHISSPDLFFRCSLVAWPCSIHCSACLVASLQVSLTCLTCPVSPELTCSRQIFWCLLFTLVAFFILSQNMVSLLDHALLGIF